MPKVVTTEYILDGLVALVRFDRGNKANPLSVEVMEQLRDAALALDRDWKLSAVVLTGGVNNFTMGADLSPASPSLKPTTFVQQRHNARLGYDMCRAWEDLECMTIVAMEGWCVGGGAALAVSCDLRVMGRSGTLYVPEIERGMNMSWGSIPRFVNLAGPAKTKRVVILAERLAALRAQDWGLVDEVVDDGQAVTHALEIAKRVAQLPMVQVRMCKEAINQASNALNRAVSKMDRDVFMLATTSPDFQEGVRAFLEKRPAAFGKENKPARPKL